MGRKHHFSTLHTYIICLGLGITINLLSAPNLEAGSPEGPGLGARAISMGGAFIGLADDWTAAYWNPAGLAGQKANCGITIDRPYSKVRDDSSIANPPTPNPNQKDPFRQLGPGEPTQFKKTIVSNSSVLPGAGVAMPLKNMALAAAVYQPLGYSTEWADSVGSVEGRYNTELRLTIMNLSTAAQVAPTLSLGAGVNFLMGESKYVSRKSTPAYSIRDYAKTNGQSVEGIFGLLFTPLEWLSIGGVYRTGSQITFEGDRDIDSTSPFVTSEHNKIRQVFNQPETYGIGLAFKPLSNWTISADWQHTEWEDMRTQRWLQPVSASMPNRNVSADWHSTDRWRLGTEYKPFEKGLALRAGFYYDPSQLPNRAVSMSNLVEVDRRAITMGVGYETKNYQFDLCYVYSWGSAKIYNVHYEKTVNSFQGAFQFFF